MGVAASEQIRQRVRYDRSESDAYHAKGTRAYSETAFPASDFSCVRCITFLLVCLTPQAAHVDALAAFLLPRVYC
jgi:hypothetical protein